ncbi:MAG: Flp family type IVb pilin [Actinomycetes bacterium]
MRGRRGRTRSERGASLVEYALIVALLALPTFGGIKMMQNAAASKISATAVGMSTHTIPSVPVAP